MINKVILVGNVGVDPEIRTTESGVKVARVRLATTERLFDRQSNTTKEHTEWHAITLWRGLADVVDKYVRKGAQIYVEGRLRSREWEKDGVRHFAVDIVADDMKLLGRRPDGAMPQNAPQQYQQPAQGGYQQQYQQPVQGGYQQQYQQPAPTPAPAQMPVAPSIPAEDPDDLPF